MKYKIEKRVKLPPKQPRGKGSSQYPLMTMKVGESFSFPPKELNKVVNAKNYVQARYGLSFSVRSKESRIWRTK